MERLPTLFHTRPIIASTGRLPRAGAMIQRAPVGSPIVRRDLDVSVFAQSRRGGRGSADWPRGQGPLLKAEGVTRCRAVYRLAAAFALTYASSALAQRSVGGDLSLVQRYVFRGEVMVSRLSVEPRIWLNAQSRVGEFSLGAWSLIEPWTPLNQDFSLRGTVGTTLSEWDLWTETIWRLFGQDVTLGVTRYQLATHSLGRMASWPSAEGYVGAERASGSPISDGWWYRVRYWRGIASSNRQYAEGSLGPQWLLVPRRDVSLSVTGSAGVNVSRPHPDAGSNGATTARGVSHYALAATLVSVPHCDDAADENPLERVRELLLPKQLSVRTQFGRDRATRLLTRTQERAALTWVEVAWSPGRCATRRP
ncbi:MAG: hypothetical protein NVS4B3_20340 [Gemmatimonadaceae bacterium]